MGLPSGVFSHTVPWDPGKYPYLDVKAESTLRVRFHTNSDQSMTIGIRVVSVMSIVMTIVMTIDRADHGTVSLRTPIRSIARGGYCSRAMLRTGAVSTGQTIATSRRTSLTSDAVAGGRIGGMRMIAVGSVDEWTTLIVGNDDDGRAGSRICRWWSRVGMLDNVASDRGSAVG